MKRGLYYGVAELQWRLRHMLRTDRLLHNLRFSEFNIILQTL